MVTHSQGRNSLLTRIRGFSELGVLSQVQDGQEQIKFYYSKMLNKAERDCSITQWELLDIMKTLDHFWKYLCGQEFHLCTDCSTLTCFKNLEVPSDSKNATAFPSTVRARSTTVLMPFPDIHARKSVCSPKS
jgi:hypothetical protein